MTLSTPIAGLLGGGAESRAAGRVGEHQDEETDGAGHVHEVKHGGRGESQRGSAQNAGPRDVAARIAPAPGARGSDAARARG